LGQTVKINDHDLKLFWCNEEKSHKTATVCVCRASDSFACIVAGTGRVEILKQMRLMQYQFR